MPVPVVPVGQWLRRRFSGVLRAAPPPRRHAAFLKKMRAPVLLAYAATVVAQGATGPVWSPPLGTPAGTLCSGATGPVSSNVSALFSLGAGVGQPWQPALSVAVAPYGQMIFYTGAPATTLNSLSASGGTIVFRNPLTTTYFPLCSATLAATAPATDALRVFTAVACTATSGGFNVFAAAADMSTGAPVWSTTPAAVATSTTTAFSAPTLLVAGSRLWVGGYGGTSPSILDVASGALLASNFSPASPYCDLMTASYAVCSGSAAAAPSQTFVLSAATLPPTPAWSNYMLAELIAVDASQLIATTGLDPTSLSLDGFDLATGALAWSLPCPWQGFGSAALAYDDAGTLFAAWLGYDETQRFSAIVASYSIAGGAAAEQLANVSIAIPYATNAIQGFVLANSGKVAYLTLADSTGTSILALAVAESSLTISATPLTAPAGTALQAVPGPQDGQMIIGQLPSGSQPSMAVYASS